MKDRPNWWPEQDDYATAWRRGVAFFLLGGNGKTWVVECRLCAGREALRRGWKRERADERLNAHECRSLEDRVNAKLQGTIDALNAMKRNT